MDGITTMQLLFSYNVKVTYFTNVIKSSGDVTANPTMGREKKRIQFQVKVHRYIRVWVNFQCLCFGKSVNGRVTSWHERNVRCLLKYWFVAREITSFKVLSLTHKPARVVKISVTCPITHFKGENNYIIL